MSIYSCIVSNVCMQSKYLIFISETNWWLVRIEPHSRAHVSRALPLVWRWRAYRGVSGHACTAELRCKHLHVVLGISYMKLCERSWCIPTPSTDSGMFIKLITRFHYNGYAPVRHCEHDHSHLIREPDTECMVSMRSKLACDMAMRIRISVGSAPRQCEG